MLSWIAATSLHRTRMVEGTSGSHHKVGAMKMAKHSMNVAGIDTGKAVLDIAVHGRADCWQVSNDLAGWHRLAKILCEADVGRVGIEASGGYERGVVAHLREAGFRVSLHQPVQVKAFATMKLRRAKNDRLDAHLIAAFTAILGVERPAPDPRFQAFTGHLTFIEQVEEDIVRAKTRLEHQRDPRLRRQLEGDLARATRRRQAELVRLAAALRAHDDIARRLDLVLSIPGIGERTAVALIVGMPELGSLSREEAASLAGLAPYDHDSGQLAGERHIAGGRARVRTALYAAALPASYRWNDAIVALRTRLAGRGKTHKLTMIACARKLLIYANTVLERGTPWQDTAPKKS
jgi:transposase